MSFVNFSSEKLSSEKSSDEEKLRNLDDESFKLVQECLLQIAKSPGGIRIKLLELLEKECRRRNSAFFLIRKEPSEARPKQEVKEQNN
jgi:hypothetical protein